LRHWWRRGFTCARTYSKAIKKVGLIEKVSLIPSDLVFEAKMDTGAATSSVHAENIQNFQRDGKDWVRLTVINKNGVKLDFERSVVRIAKIKRAGTEVAEGPIPVRGVLIPNWDDLLRIAVQSYELTNLGYQGIGLVLESERGPLMLELNARPGLNIQIANGEGIAKRLELIETNIETLTALDDRVAFA